MNFPDVASVSRYLGDPDRYWIFYVNDLTDVSISFRAWEPGTALPAPQVSSEPFSHPAPGATTLSGAPVSVADTIARTSTVVRTPTPTGSVGGPLRGTSPGSATTPSGRALPTDSAARRSAAERTPPPTGTIVGGLREESPSTGTVSAVPTPAADSSARTRQLTDRRIWDVQVEPGPLGVRISFHALVDGVFNRTQRVWAWISTERPSWDERERQWSYPNWHAFMSTEVRMLDDGRYEVQPSSRLEQGRRYYYLIQVHGADASSPNVQRTGSFTADIRHPLNGLFSH